MGTKFQILVQATRVGTSAHEPEIYEIPLEETEKKSVFEVLGWDRDYIPKPKQIDWWKLSGSLDDMAEQIGKDVGAMAADALITGIQHTVIRRPAEVKTVKNFIREKFEESIAGVYQHRLEAEQATAREEYVRMKQALHGEGWTPSPYEEREMDAKTSDSWYILYEIQVPYDYDELTREQQERLRGAVKAYLPIQHYEDTTSVVDDRDFLVIADERIKSHDCRILSVENGKYSSQPYPEEEKAKMRKGIDMLMLSIEEERRDAGAVLAQVEPIVEQGETLAKRLSQDYPNPDKAKKKGIFAKFRDVAEKALKKALALPEKIMGVYSGAIKTLERKKVHQWRAYETAKKYADETIAKVPDIGAILKQQEERRKEIIRDYQQVTYPIVKTEPIPVSDSDDEKFYAEISKRIREARQPIIDRLARLEEKVSERKELLLDLMDFGTASLEQRNETIKNAVATTMKAVMEERKHYYLSEERRLQEEIAERNRVEKLKDEMTALAKKKEMLERELREVEKRQDELKSAILLEGNAVISQKESEERWKKDEKSLGRETNSKKGRDTLWYGR